jgi:hypothetical protein
MDPLLLHAGRPPGDLYRAGAAHPRILEKIGDQPGVKLD